MAQYCSGSSILTDRSVGGRAHLARKSVYEVRPREPDHAERWLEAVIMS